MIYEVDQTVQTTLALVFELNAINATANTIYIPNNGLANNALVTYDPGAGNTAITGLNTTDTYQVIDVNPAPLSGASYDSSDTFELWDVTTNQMAHISQGSALGTQTFTDAAGNYSFGPTSVQKKLLAQAGSCSFTVWGKATGSGNSTINAALNTSGSVG